MAQINLHNGPLCVATALHYDTPLRVFNYMPPSLKIREDNTEISMQLDNFTGEAPVQFSTTL